MFKFQNVLYILFSLRVAYGLLDPPSTDQISELVKAVNILNQTVDILQTENKRLNQKVVDLENSLNAQKTHMTTPIAFSVALTGSNRVIGDHQAIEYNHIITNIGNAYDPRHGHFVAPIKGIYLFSVSAMSGYGTHGSETLYLQLVKNGAEIGRMYSSAGTDTSSISVLVSLVAGDMVWVRSFATPSQTIHGDLFDMFAGSLIFKL